MLLGKFLARPLLQKKKESQILSPSNLPPSPPTMGNGSENHLFCPRLRIPEADTTVEASKTKVRKMPETFILIG